MSFWNIQRPIDQDKPVVGSHHFSAERSVQIEKANVGNNKYGDKWVPAGLFIAKVEGETRFLPRDLVQGDVETTSNQVSVRYPELFKVGDALYATEPVGLITLAATWAAGDTVKIQFTVGSMGIQTQYLHTQVGANLAALDDELVAALNLETNPLSTYARFEVGTAGQIIVYSKGLPLELSVAAVTAGDGTAVVTDEINLAPRYVGDVLFVDYEGQVLTLSANAAEAISEGGQIGTLTEELYGFYNHSIDFTERPSVTIKAIDRCDRVYTACLPYFDHQLVARFPRVKFDKL